MSKIKTAAVFFAVVALLLGFCVFMTACYDGYRENHGIEGYFEEKTPVGDEDKEENGSNGIMTVKISVIGTDAQFTVKLYDNKTAEELYSKLPLKLEMNDMPHEKYCYLDFSLPKDEEKPRNIVAGDIMLWGDNCIVLFYESFESSYSYTRLGRITNAEGIENVMKGGITLVFEAA